MHILQTRPQGEKSAELALKRRGVHVTRPTEIIVTRRKLKGGRTECLEKEVALIPSYVVAKPADAHALGVALGDMAVREPRRDVQRVVGRVSDDAMAHVMARHGARVEAPDVQKILAGMVCQIIDGPMSALGSGNPRVTVESINRKGEAECNMNGCRVTIPLPHLRQYRPPSK